MRVAHGFEPLWHDLTFSFRQLRRSPAFTLVAAVTLALGIGANSAIFALVDAALLRPLPFPAPDRLVMVWERSERSAHAGVSPLNMTDWNERGRTFESIAGFVPNIGGMVMNGRDGAAETVTRQWVTAGFFDAIGVKAIAGRTFLPADHAARSNVVVLSEARGDALRPRPHCRRPRHPPRRHDVHGRGHRAKDFQLLGRTSMWAMIARSPAELRRAHAPRHRPDEAGRHDRSRARGDDDDRRGPGAGIPRHQHRAARHDRADARRVDRRRAAHHVAAVSRGRRLRAGDLLRQRRQPAADARDRADARVRHPLGARRQPAARDPPARHREPRCSRRWAARSASASAPRFSPSRRR